MVSRSKILFSEKQRFKQWWLWLILLVINAYFLFGVLKQTILAQPFGNNPVSNTWLFAITGFSVALTLLFAVLHLETRVTEDGVYVRFFPLRLAFSFYAWEGVKNYALITYSPMGEYGGWGIRFGGSGLAYNVSGNKGLQLEFANNKKLLIGTNKPDELAAVLREIKH